MSMSFEDKCAIVCAALLALIATWLMFVADSIWWIAKKSGYPLKEGWN
jgi:hypothetical protein